MPEKTNEINRPHHFLSKPSLTERIIYFYTLLCTLVILGSIAFLLFFLLIRGIPSLSLDLIFGNTSPIDALLLKRQVFDGIFPAVAGTFILVVLSVIMAVPVGIFIGIYMAEYSTPKIKQLLELLFDMLSGIPSIVVGLAGFSVSLLLHRLFNGRIGPCLMVSAISLAFLVLPYIVKTTQISLESIPFLTKHTGIALGATRFQNVVHVLLPEAFSGIVSGIILALGRCAEDTAVIMLTGVVASAGIPDSLFKGFEALPFYIYYISSQYADAQELSRGFGACLVLLAICGILFFLAIVIQKKVKKIILYGI